MGETHNGVCDGIIGGGGETLWCVKWKNWGGEVYRARCICNGIIGG